MSRLKMVTDPRQKMEEKGTTGSVVDLMEQVILRSLGVPLLLFFPKSPTEKQSRAWWQRREKGCGGSTPAGSDFYLSPKRSTRVLGLSGRTAS